MVSTKYGIPFIAIGTASMIFVLLAVSVAGLSPSEIFAQGTNATGASAGGGGQTTVVMPQGSSAATSGAGYDPPEVKVSPGATIVWDNKDTALHTATSGKSPTPDQKFDSGVVGPNQESKPVTMPTEPGEYPYFCTLHPFLQGTVIVQ
jgi:plastocyanin